MPTPLTNHTAICADDPPWSPDEAQVAAAAFLARYNGRTLEAYRHDLRYYFQWATDQHLAVLDASRAHIEIYRSMTEQRGLAASTIDRLLSTVCGYYRFAHLDGRIPAHPAQYVRRPKVDPTEQHATDRGELGRFLFTPKTTTDPTPHSPCYSASTDSASPKQAQRTSRTSRSSAVTEHCASSAKATNPPSSRWSRAPPARSTSPSANATKDRSCYDAAGNDSTDAPHIAGCDQSANEPVSATSIPTCCAPRSSRPPSTPASRYAPSNSLPATPQTSSSPSSPADEPDTSRHFDGALRNHRHAMNPGDGLMGWLRELRTCRPTRLILRQQPSWWSACARRRLLGAML